MDKIEEKEIIKQTFKLEKKIETEGTIAKIILLKDARLCSALINGTIFIYNLDNYKIEKEINTENKITDIIQLSDNNICIGCNLNYSSFFVKIYKIDNYELKEKIDIKYEISKLIEINNKLLVCSYDKEIIMLKIFEKNKSDNFICIGTLFSNPFNSICYLPLDNNGNNFFKENPFDININNLDQLNMFQFIQKKGQEKMNYYNNLINSFIMIESNIDIDFIINFIDEKDKKKIY